MSLKPYATLAGKAVAAFLSGIGALVASALFGMYVILLCAGPLGNVATGVLFAGVVLLVLTALVLGLRKLSWTWRAAIGVLLIAGSFLVLPRPTCAAHTQSNEGC